MLLRTLTAFIGIPVLVVAVWFGAPWLTMLVLAAAVLTVREAYRLLPPNSGTLPYVLGAMWVVALVMGAQAATSLSNFLIISAGILAAGAFLSILWLIAFYDGARYLVAGTYIILGPVYVGFLLAHSLLLRDLEGGANLGRDWLLAVLLITFATDTGAFLVGRSIGRLPMAPGISPNKTWEGAVGGFGAAITVALALGFLLDLGIPDWQLAIIGATVGVISQLGDLFESKLKRIANVKDAGSIIPGHGGLLDRLDSLLVSIPAVYYFLSTVFEP